MAETHTVAEKVSLKTALSRGLRRRCPACGEAKAFRGYLKVVDTCSHCQTPLATYPADDGPAYVTMLLVGHLIVAPMFMFEFYWVYPLPIVAATMVIGMGALTLAVLPYVKGGWLALMWHLGMRKVRNGR